MTRAVLAAVFLLSVGPSRAMEEAPLLQEAVAAYRAGRPFEALDKLGALVEKEPGNALAKNYIWTITGKIRSQDKAEGVSPAEAEKAASLARKVLAERRTRTRETLEELRRTANRVGGARRPSDILDDMEGAHKFLGADLQDDLARAQAQGYLDSIVADLTRALEKNAFVSRKEQLKAEGYRAYLKGDLPEAARFWEQSLREDPGDKSLAKELAALKDVVARKGREERIGDLIYQAKAHFRAGDYAEALSAWKDVLKLDPRRPGAVEQAAVCRAALEKAGLKRRMKEKINEGVALYKGGDALAAAQKWLDVLMDDPGNEEARGWLEHAGRKIRGQSPTVVSRVTTPSTPVASGASAQPEKALEFYKQGIMFYAQNDLEKAVQSWRESLRLDPGLSRAREALRQAQMEINLR